MHLRFSVGAIVRSQQIVELAFGRFRPRRSIEQASRFVARRGHGDPLGRRQPDHDLDRVGDVRRVTARAAVHTEAAGRVDVWRQNRLDGRHVVETLLGGQPLERVRVPHAADGIGLVHDDAAEVLDDRRHGMRLEPPDHLLGVVAEGADVAKGQFIVAALLASTLLRPRLKRAPAGSLEALRGHRQQT